MKLVVLKYRKDKKGRGKSTEIKVERMLLTTFVIVFIALIFIQTALMNPYFRTILSVNNELEGEPLAAEVFLYREGRLSLGLVAQDRNQDLKVLVNGDVKAEFSYNIVEVFVKDGDVVEVDGSAIDHGIEVEVLSKSDNISTSCVGKRIKVQSDIKTITRININK